MNIHVDINRCSFLDVPKLDNHELQSVYPQIKNQKPFVFNVNWPAISKWSPDYIAEIGGEERVLVSTSIEEQSGPTGKREMRLGEYIDLIKSLDGNPAAERRMVPYLKQFDIFSLFPHLLEDIDFGFLKQGRKEIAFWFGTKFSITGLHSDPNDGVLAQIYGSKRVYLFAPNQRDLLYPNGKFDPATECCDADAAKPDYARHPNFRQARGHVVEIFPGEALYIPKGWYHQVVGLETNMSVNCFFFSYLRYLTTDFAFCRLPRWLHDHGLYKKGNCVCHGKPAPKSFEAVQVAG